MNIIDDKRDPDLPLLIATLCDAMKRLECAIESDAVDRKGYLEEAAKRRKYVENKLLEDEPN